MAAMQQRAQAKQATEPAKAPEPTRYCVDCKFIRSYTAMHYCTGAPRNLVTGDKQELECNDMRRFGGQCGPEGKLFVAKLGE